MTVVYAAGIPVFFYLLARAFKVDQIADELVSNEYLRSLLVAYCHDARTHHAVLKKSLHLSHAKEKDHTRTIEVCTGLLFALQTVEGHDHTDTNGTENRDEDEAAERLCPACDRLAKAWKQADLPKVGGTAHLRVLVDKLGLVNGTCSEEMTVGSVVSTVLGVVNDETSLAEVHGADDLKEEHLRVLAKQDWNTLVPPRRDSCYRCSHSIKASYFSLLAFRSSVHIHATHVPAYAYIRTSVRIHSYQRTHTCHACLKKYMCLVALQTAS